MDIERSRLPAFMRPALPVWIAVLWVLLFGVTFVDLWPRWTRWDGSLAHGLPVLAIFFYLLHRTGAWSVQAWLPVTLERWLSAAALLFGSLLWFMAYAVNIEIIEQLMLLPLLVGLYALVYGWRTVFEQRFLLVFLIFAIPVWGSLNGVLLEAASTVVGQLVRWAQMPANIQGNSIYIPFGHILIADGCSGLRYFVIALTLAYLMAYLNGYREGKLLVALAIAAALGLLTNWLRIFILIAIGYHTRMESSLMEDHEMFGWILFGLICFPALYFAPVTRRQPPDNSGAKWPGRGRLMASLVLAAAGPLLALGLTLTFKPGDLSDAPVGTAPDVNQTPVRVNAPSAGMVDVSRPGRGVSLRRDTYQRQRLDEKLVPYLPRLFDHQRWLLEVDRTECIANAEVSYQVLVRKDGDERVAWLQWFDVGGRVTANRVMAKLLQVPATLKQQNHFEIVTLQKRCLDKRCADARSVLLETAETLLSP